MLHRSGTRPLTVRIYEYGNHVNDRHVRDFLERIRAQSWRWRALQINVPYTGFKDTLEILRGSYPLLDRLDIELSSYSSAPATEFQRTGFSQYPNLKTVVLQNPLILEMDFPWAQITTLIITECFKGDLMSYSKAFRQCPSLQTLQVDFSARHPTLEDVSLVVPLLALKSLNTASNTVINLLEVPQLEDARLGVDYPRNHDEGVLNGTLPSFYKLVLRSKCALTITSIHLRKIRVTEDLLALLLLTTNLATLEIRAKMSHFDGTSDPVGRKTIMTLLSMLEVTDQPFLPKLRHISINLSKHLEMRYFPYLPNQYTLVNVLQSRWNVESGSGVEKLRTFRFGIFAQCLDDKKSSLARCTFRSDSPLETQLYPNTEEALQHLMDDGMKISIRVYSKFARHDAKHVRLNFGNM
ncbi:hypothetical protein BDZ89DRAFT_1067371 [Hymenopellis radicata]|nr:hypothetical protein BDZ89DRAFT_1067371 [Hymenopellis radicata]